MIAGSGLPAPSLPSPNGLDHTVAAGMFQNLRNSVPAVPINIFKSRLTFVKTSPNNLSKKSDKCPKVYQQTIQRSSKCCPTVIQRLPKSLPTFFQKSP